MKPGIYKDIPNDAYHGGAGHSKSQLDLIARSPAHFKSAMDIRADMKAKGIVPTVPPHYIIGTAFHAAVLEPELFGSTYCLAMRASDHPGAIEGRDSLAALVERLNEKRLPKLSSSGSKAELTERILAADSAESNPITPDLLEPLKGAELKAMIEEMNKVREGKLSTAGTIPELTAILRDNGVEFTLMSDLREEWNRNNSHRIVLSQEDFDTVRGMRDSVFAHKAARALLRNGTAEQSVYWKCPRTGILLRCRPDWWTPSNIMVDLKSTDDASPEEFARSVVKWRYHVQDAMYKTGASRVTRKKQRFAFIVCEKKPPYAVAVYVLDDLAVQVGMKEFERDVDTLAQCLESGRYPAFSDDIQSLELPFWYVKNSGVDVTA